MGIPAAESRRAIEASPARRHLFWVLVCALLVVGSTFLPYLYAYLTTPAGLQFQGILVLPQDLFGYLAKMQLGAGGEWLFRLVYTSESHDGAFLFPFYLSLGRLGAALGLPPVLTFHLARLAIGVLLLAAVFYFALAIFGRADRAWACFGVAALSSGFGWLASLFGHLPSDLLIPEATTYYAIFANPHFPIGFVLLIAALLAMLKAVERQQAKYAVAAGLLTLAQTSIQPFLVITVYAVVSIWLVWRWTMLRRPARAEAGYLGLLIALPAPGLIYDYAALYLNPVLSQWSAQNITPSPPLYDYLLGYGLLAFLAALGVVQIWRMEKAELLPFWWRHGPSQKDEYEADKRMDNPSSSAYPLPRRGTQPLDPLPRVPLGSWVSTRLTPSPRAIVSTEAGRLLLVWVAVTLVLMYSPFSLQRRMSAGLHVALSLLAVVGLYGYILPRFPRPSIGKEFGRRIWGIVVLTMVPSNVLLLTFTAVGAGSYPYPLYLKDGEVSALRWLGENTTALDTVLSSESTGNIIPALAGNRVFYGHPFETIEARRKKSLLERFFSGGMSSEEERQLLSEYGISLIYYGRSERGLGPFDPGVRPYLAPVFGNGEVNIYRLKDTR